MISSLQIGYSRVTEWAYAPDGGVLRQVLWDEATGDQVTRYEYGTTLAQSGVATSGLLVRKVLPTGDATALTYNRQGEVVTMTDANGSVHEYRRDLLGRAIDDAVTTLASGVDGAVRRLSSGYDVRGRLQSLSSHSAPETGAGVMLNEVKFDYNGIDCLTADIQSHAGAVDEDTPRVQYTCTAAVDAVLRRKTIVYPNGRIVAYEYGDPHGIDDVLNRVQSVHDEDLTVLAEFRYLGAGTPAVMVLSEPGLERRWKALEGQPVGDAGDPYTGYDRFGRVENMLWWKPSTSTAAVQVGWGYDRASRRTWRRDVLADVALTTGGDQAFTYDALSQVRGRDVGRLNTNATAIGGIPAEQEAFKYDEAGNWLGYELLANGAPQIEQTRVSNRSNQLVQVDGSSAGLSYDANGNMLTVPTGDDLTGEPRRLEWDAWNRLRRVYNNGGTLMAEYEYDAQARRIVVRRSGEEARQVYYNDSWRSVEERQVVPPPPPSSSSSSSSSSGSSVPVPVVQHVWQPASRWEMILRDRATTPGGELDQRGYPLKDVLDVVALSDAGGAVIERYSYSAFGGTTFMDASFAEQSTSAYGWEFLFHAEFRDADTGWYNYGYRYYSTELGRWLARDPIGEKDYINIYAFVGNTPLNTIDLLGLERCQTDRINLAEGGRTPTILGVKLKGEFFVRGQRETCCCVENGRSDKTVQYSIQAGGKAGIDNVPLWAPLGKNGPGLFFTAEFQFTTGGNIKIDKCKDTITGSPIQGQGQIILGLRAQVINFDNIEIFGALEGGGGVNISITCSASGTCEATFQFQWMARLRATAKVKFGKVWQVEYTYMRTAQDESAPIRLFQF